MAAIAVPRRILPAIIVAQFAGSSVWFASNAVIPDLQRRANLPAETLGDMTTAQLGFIIGTLVFAFFAVADRHSPRRIFLVCAMLGAAFNAATYFAGARLWPLLSLRFVTGFFLAGIYPVGMKIASGWFRSRAWKSLGLPRRRAGARNSSTAYDPRIRSHHAVGSGHALGLGDRSRWWPGNVRVRA